MDKEEQLVAMLSAGLIAKRQRWEPDAKDLPKDVLRVVSSAASFLITGQQHDASFADTLAKVLKD
jgi:hypothetical protein